MPDFQLSLAIGKEGQNARLAARLTGWRIDIRSDDEQLERLTGRGAGVTARPGSISGAASAVGLPRSGASNTTFLHARNPRPSRARSGRVWDVGKRAAKSELLRVTAGSDATASRPSYPIRQRTAPGRGAHLHPTTECFELAVRRKAFGRALRVTTGLSSAPVGEYLDSHAHQP